MSVLVTKWFGVFLCDERTGKVIEQRLMPKDDAQAVAGKLAAMQRGGVLDEERELAALAGGKLSVGERRQSELGKPEMFDSSHIIPGTFGYRNAYMHEVMMALGKLRTSEPVPRDSSLVQAIRNLDNQIATINLYSERLHEWYGMHFPELADHVRDQEYADLIARYGERSEIVQELGLDIESIGAEFDPDDMRAVQDLADTLYRLYDDKSQTEAYIQGIVEQTCPNMCALLNGPLAARMISLAGGLERLSSLPSSTVQLLGSEKAMFRHLKTGAAPPKHGIIYQHPAVHRAPKWQRGNIARALAGKVLIAAKIDQYHGEYRGDVLNEEFLKRVEDIQRRYPDPPKRPRKSQARQRRRPSGGKRRRTDGLQLK